MINNYELQTCFLLLLLFVCLFVILVLHYPSLEIRAPTPGKSTAGARAALYPFLSGYAIFSCVQTMLWLPVFGIFNTRTDVDACDCTRRLYGHRKRVCTESRLWEKTKSCRTVESNQLQYCGWHFGPTFSQLVCSAPGGTLLRQDLAHFVVVGWVRSYVCVCCCCFFGGVRAWGACV